jgi:pectate lyase
VDLAGSGVGREHHHHRARRDGGSQSGGAGPGGRRSSRHDRQSVSWSGDPASLGTIDATSGIYTAPAAPGTYKVWATSNADPSKKGVASVTVTAPPTSTTPTPTPPPTTSLPPGVVPAFPGAEGGGANSEGGRGGAVYEVTNLNDSGAGSLRACVEASGPRTCVFRVAGRIQLASKIRITNPYAVAGQTAPGGGITISGTTISGSWSNSMFHISTHDVVFRYLRLRRGDNSVASSGLAFFVENDAYNLVFDHLSLSWSQQEPFAVFPTQAGTNSISIQWSMLFDTLVHWYVEENHNVSLSLSAYTSAAAATVTDVDLHHNYITDGSRLPLFKLKSGSLVNNVIYNWSYFATLSGGGVMLDIIGNRYKAGPRTPSSGPSSREIDAYNNTACPDNQGPCGTPSLYVAGNTKKDGTIPGDQWSLTSQTSGEAPDGSSPVPNSWRRAGARAVDPITWHATVPSHSGSSGDCDGGASQRLGCDGTWVANRDNIDAAAIVEYDKCRDLQWTEADAGGFPSIVAGTACADTDHDGIPDAYEQAACGMSTCLDGNAVQADGYTNLEKYLNGR